MVDRLTYYYHSKMTDCSFRLVALQHIPELRGLGMT